MAENQYNFRCNYFHRLVSNRILLLYVSFKHLSSMQQLMLFIVSSFLNIFMCYHASFLRHHGGFLHPQQYGRSQILNLRLHSGIELFSVEICNIGYQSKINVANLPSLLNVDCCLLPSIATHEIYYKHIFIHALFY